MIACVRCVLSMAGTQVQMKSKVLVQHPVGFERWKITDAERRARSGLGKAALYVHPRFFVDGGRFPFAKNRF